MPIFSNLWNNIIQWFSDRSERNSMIRSFNKSASDAYVNQLAPTLLKAEISKGEPEFRHTCSSFFGSGFRIKVFSGRQLTKPEIMFIGQVLLADQTLVRKMIILGFDTLEIHCDRGNYGCRWQIREALAITQQYNERHDTY